MALTLESINQQLKNSKAGVSVRQRGNRLSLRATLPPKLGCDRPWHQQDIALSIYASQAGLQRALKEAQLLGARLALKEFDWSQYLKEMPQHDTCKAWIEKFKDSYFAQRGISDHTQHQWHRHFWACFKKLPQDEKLTKKVILDAIAKTDPTRNERKLMCSYLGRLARFANIDIDLNKYRGKQQTMMRELPTDEMIIETYHSIKNARWQWFYGVVACYGLRPHEVFFSDFSQAHEAPYLISVLEGKTGPRKVYPLPPQWVQDWHLWKANMPQIKARTHTDYGHVATTSLLRYGVKRAYDLRHAYAVRGATEYNLPPKIVADWMGHGVAMHLETYQKWIDQSTHQKVYEQMVLCNNRA